MNPERNKDPTDGLSSATVSIVIPCYAQAHLLSDAIESALAQDHPHVEIVVVDDGSPDNTSEVASSYTSVRLVRQRRGGLSAARNAGLAASTGRFVCFLDADDRLRPNAIRAGLDAFREHPHAAFVAGGHVKVDREWRPIAARGAERLTGDPYLALLRGNFIGMHAAVLYRREAVVAAGGFDPSLSACEDYDLYLRIARSAPVHQHDVVVAEYRRHEGNMSRDARLMLWNVLGVLTRQLRYVLWDVARVRAYGQGLRNWTDYYVGGLHGSRDVVANPGLVNRRYVIPRAAVTLKRILPTSVRRALRLGRSLIARPPPSVGRVDMGDLRRIHPISQDFGFDRGRPVDRYYIESFLARHANDITGRVLEIGSADYTHRFGGERVQQADVLHVSEGNPEATFVGRLDTGDVLPSGAFDCVVLTQTLHLIFDIPAALRTVARILKSGGVLLATVPGISQVDRGEWGATWSWGIMPYAISRLMRDAFPGATVMTEAHGNVLACTAFLHGLADVELSQTELDYHDPAYPMISTVRVVRS